MACIDAIYLFIFFFENLMNTYSQFCVVVQRDL